MNYTMLSAEIRNDTENLGIKTIHEGVLPEDAKNIQIAALLNAPTQSRNRVSMTGSEVLNAIDGAEWMALDDADRKIVWNVLHLGDLNPFGIEADLLLDVFGGTSTTINTLKVIRVESISRATELGFGNVTAGDVERARNL